VLYQLSYSRMCPEWRRRRTTGRLVSRGVGQDDRTCEPGHGAEGNRTPDLLNAIQALSQLSYGPGTWTSSPRASSAGAVQQGLRNRAV
jgi:hypothetical protein